MPDLDELAKSMVRELRGVLNPPVYQVVWVKAILKLLIQLGEGGSDGGDMEGDEGEVGGG